MDAVAAPPVQRMLVAPVDATHLVAVLARILRPPAALPIQTIQQARVAGGGEAARLGGDVIGLLFEAGRLLREFDRPPEGEGRPGGAL